MCDGRELIVVKVGIVHRFPMSGALLYYCGDDDMLYFFAMEELEDEREHERPGRHLYEFRRFGKMMDEFP